MEKPIKVILDTDIGDDIDDALALALILASPEFQLLGVTTVFKNTLARARQARTILKIAGQQFENIPVAAGCGASMASRQLLGAMEGYLKPEIPNQDSTCLPESQLSPLDRRHAVEFLIETLLVGDGDIVPITIGAMTNLAMAMIKEPKIRAKIPRIVVMAAEFRSPFAEWNIRCDPEAAHVIFSSGIPVNVITWHIGHVVHFDASHVDRLARSTRPLAQRLHAMILAWRKSIEKDWPNAMPSLYDPMAVATILRPDLCTWKTGSVAVELRGESTYGFTTFEEKKDGPHTIAWDADREKSLDFYLDRVLNI